MFPQESGVARSPAEESEAFQEARSPGVEESPVECLSLLIVCPRPYSSSHRSPSPSSSWLRTGPERSSPQKTEQQEIQQDITVSCHVYRFRRRSPDPGVDVRLPTQEESYAGRSRPNDDSQLTDMDFCHPVEAVTGSTMT